MVGGGGGGFETTQLDPSAPLPEWRPEETLSRKKNRLKLSARFCTERLRANRYAEQIGSEASLAQGSGSSGAFLHSTH